MANESVYILGDDDRRKFARLVAQTWSDDAAKARYEHEPRTVLGEYGIAYPDGVPTPELPVKPVGDLSIEELELAAGMASCFGTAGTFGTFGGCLGTGGTFGSAG